MSKEWLYKSSTSYISTILYLSSPITEEVVNEKFWKNHRSLLHTFTILCTNFSSIRSLQTQEMDFLIISSLFSFLYLSSSIAGEVANEKFWKNHRILLHTPTISYTNFSSIHSQ